jgi:formylglycine-generating enzyme
MHRLGLIVVAVTCAALGLGVGCRRPQRREQSPAPPAASDRSAASAGSDFDQSRTDSGQGPLPDGLIAAPVRTAPPVSEDPETVKACPAGMVLISGEYCPFMGHRCVDWIDEKADRCARYVEPPICEGKIERRRFCIDRYEYPNLEGVKPVVMVNWIEAFQACEAESKRLCLSTEWTLACEGVQRLPYPYGYARDRRVCNIDRPRPVPEPDMEAFSVPRRVALEVARLDLRVETAVLQGCVSPFAVHDMTGNVDEWVINEQHFDKELKEGEKPPYVSGLKGGYWGPIRARCRPITPSHNEWFRFYQVGFRCCSDAQDTPDGVANKYMRKLGRFHTKSQSPPSPAP